jgi:mono/diheme cytochrome c family protein
MSATAKGRTFALGVLSSFLPLLASTAVLGAPPSTTPAASAVSRGAYLARAGDCISCHTASDGKPLAGGTYLPTPFGSISVPNITPDPTTGIGSWTDEQFYRAMHDGIGRGGEYLYPVFPFPWYSNVTREDVLAIKAYLFSQPPVRSPRKPLRLSFPARERESLLAWRTLFFKVGEFRPATDRPEAVNRGAYLVEGLGHCGECHNRRNVAGVSRWSGNLEGGEIEGWYAPNLTSDKREGVGTWTTAQIAAFLKTGSAPYGGVVLGPMSEVIRDSTSHLTDEDLSAIAAYLKSVPPKQEFASAVPSGLKGARAPGSQEYLSYCASCHGVQGEGIAGQISKLAGNGAVIAGGPEDVIRVVLGGLPAQQGLAPMPAVGRVLTDAQVAAAVNYVRNAFGNAAPATAAPGLVATLRSETRTVLNGDPPGGRCPEIPDPEAARALHSGTVTRELSAMTEVNMLATIDRLLPQLRSAAPHIGTDALVNDMTSAYCTVLQNRGTATATRSTSLGNFAMLSYGQLRTNGRD